MEGWMFYCIQNYGNFVIFTLWPICAACSRELLSLESSDCDLGGVILESGLEKKKHAKWLTTYILQI